MTLTEATFDETLGHHRRAAARRFSGRPGAALPRIAGAGALERDEAGRVRVAK